MKIKFGPLEMGTVETVFVLGLGFLMAEDLIETWRGLIRHNTYRVYCQACAQLNQRPKYEEWGFNDENVDRSTDADASENKEDVAE